MVLHRIRALLGTGALLLVCGSATAVPATAAAHSSHHSSHHASRHRHHHTGGIPQHNGGDHDVDNNGGPSDGDGGF
jgi:hypothetical protein